MSDEVYGMNCKKVVQSNNPRIFKFLNSDQRTLVVNRNLCFQFEMSGTPEEVKELIELKQEGLLSPQRCEKLAEDLKECLAILEKSQKGEKLSVDEYDKLNQTIKLKISSATDNLQNSISDSLKETPEDGPAASKMKANARERMQQIVKKFCNTLIAAVEKAIVIVQKMIDLAKAVMKLTEIIKGIKDLISLF